MYYITAYYHKCSDVCIMTDILNRFVYYNVVLGMQAGTYRISAYSSQRRSHR